MARSGFAQDARERSEKKKKEKNRKLGYDIYLGMVAGDRILLSSPALYNPPGSCMGLQMPTLWKGVP